MKGMLIVKILCDNQGMYWMRIHDIDINKTTAGKLGYSANEAYNNLLKVFDGGKGELACPELPNRRYSFVTDKGVLIEGEIVLEGYVRDIEDK
jgi:hypothetical protein